MRSSQQKNAFKWQSVALCKGFYLTLSSLTAAFLSISGCFSAAGGLVAGGLPAGAGGSGECGEADEAANEGVAGSIGLDAEGSLNVRLSTDFYNKQVAHILIIKDFNRFSAER